MKKYLLVAYAILNCSASFSQIISRGPYLQLRTQNSIEIRFNTNSYCQPTVYYGLSQNQLNLQASVAGTTYQHKINLTGLQANTKYYYAIYNNGNLMQGGADNFFVTSQVVGSDQKMKLWVTGDCGIGNQLQLDVLSKFSNHVGNSYIDGWILLGDNAYQSGTEQEYQSNFFNVYQNTRFMKQTAIYPAPGNHDYYATSTARQDHIMPYYDIFASVGAGQMGGVPSGKKEYYSYNIGNVHFVSLDSYGQEAPTNYTLSDSAQSVQVAWLKADLLANKQKWTIVYFHHAPYTMGSHNSDNESDLAALRTKLVPILEQYNVDLVMAGHSHSYERSKLIKGHFGPENTFSPANHVVSSSSGYYNGTANSCPYHKKSDNSIKGTIYMVSGSAGSWPGSQASFPHEALPYANALLGGSTLLEIEGDRLDASWIASDGTVKDKFTMVKDMNQVKIVNVPAENSETFVLKSPYNELSQWEGGLQSVSIPLPNPVTGMRFNVQDLKNCFSDVLVINNLNPCPKAQVINKMILNPTALNTKNSENIEAMSIMEGNTKTYLQAKNNILLKPGFELKPGAVFTATIGNCEN